MEQRPDPDQLLKYVQADEESAGRGRLKLFFGASPGVGKTYAMLEAARQRKKESWDVAVGVVETHGRPETAALLEGLEVLPRKEINYKGVSLKEFDLDAALARHPRLILIDELAHTNAPGSRHSKRWQDVEELLDAGIDVYTTLNVQHWESLNDVVAQVTGVVIRETVPDTFLRRANDIELVDLAPEDLLKRLEDGKVYRGELAGRAADNFFKPGNLIALRELALRHAAERVDAQMQAFKERHAISDVWSIGERMLVGVTASPMSARLVRATSRLATRLHAPWIAVHVETPAYLRLPAQERARAIENLRLAEKLGAEVITVTGENVTEEILRLARSRNVTRIILGKPARPKWKEWLFGSVVNEIARSCGNIDLHIISGMGSDMSGRRPSPTPPPPADLTAMGWGVAVVALATLLCWPLSHHLDKVNLVMIYLLGVVWAAYRFGRRASLLASVLSVLSFDFFFVPPYFTFAVSDSQYFLTFSIMLIVGLLISTLTSRLRQQTDTLRWRENRIRALYKLSRDLSETPDTRQMLEKACKQLGEFYGLPVLILTPGPQGDLVVGVGDAQAFGWTDNEHSVARWVFDKAQLAGAGSDTLAGASGLYLPLKGIRSTVGVLGIKPTDPKKLMEPEELLLLETFAAEIGGALESTRMSEEMGKAEMHMESQAIGQRRGDARVRLSDVLKEDRIVLLAKGLSKEQILRELVFRLKVKNPNQAYQAILERERTAPTVIESGVAIPHARLEGLKELQAALGISSEGPQHVWILFFGPTDNPRISLAFLASIAAFFQSKEQSEALAKRGSAREILDYIRQTEVTTA
jgi:two-component system sensor histidine kinase KdpD